MWLAINETLSVNTDHLAAVEVNLVSGDGDRSSWELRGTLPNGERLCLMVSGIEACLAAKAAIDTAVVAREVTNE